MIAIPPSIWKTAPLCRCITAPLFYSTGFFAVVRNCAADKTGGSFPVLVNILTEPFVLTVHPAKSGKHLLCTGVEAFGNRPPEQPDLLLYRIVAVIPVPEPGKFLKMAHEERLRTLKLLSGFSLRLFFIRLPLRRSAPLFLCFLFICFDLFCTECF